MAKGRAVAIVLEPAEKSELTALTRKHGAPQALAERARIVLAAVAGPVVRPSEPPFSALRSSWRDRSGIICGGGVSSW